MTELSKILQVGAGLNSGGVERGIVEMAAYLHQQNWPNAVASAGGGLVVDLPQKTDHFTLPLTSKNPLTILANAWRLKRLIQQEEIGLVHARSRAPAWSAWLACLWTKTPYLTTFHGTHSAGHALKRFYNRIMLRGPLVIANSQFIKQHIQDVYQMPSDKIIVAQRGVDFSLFNPEDFTEKKLDKLATEIGVDRKKALLLLPGRISPWKGQGLFLEALSHIKQLPWQAIIVGDAGKKPKLLDDLKQKAQTLGLADRIIFLPHRNDLPAFYQLADLSISAATEPEAFGRTVIEAMAMECPVIAAAHGGALETVVDDKTGWLFHPGKADDLAQKIGQALQKKEALKVVGKTGRDHVLENFTTETMCRKEAGVYRRLLNLAG